jgi:hypothetical protein
MQMTSTKQVTTTEWLIANIQPYLLYDILVVMQTELLFISTLIANHAFVFDSSFPIYIFLN